MKTLDVFLTLGAESRARIGFALATVAWWMNEGKRLEQHGRKLNLHIQDIGASRRFWDAATALGMDWLEDRTRCYPREGSQRQRHAWAAMEAKSDPYLLVDDDCVLTSGYTVEDIGKGIESYWLDYVERLMTERPTLAMVAPIPSPGGLDPSVGRAFLEQMGATREQGRALADAMQIPTSDKHIWHVRSVGGIRVVRLGVIPTDVEALPPLNPNFAGGYDTTLGSYLDHKGYECGYVTRWQLVHLGYGRSTAAAVDKFKDEGDL